MQRRKFIQNSLGLAALSFAGSRIHTFANNNIPMSEVTCPAFKRSIMWGTVSMEGSVMEKCKAIKAAGYDGIEPNSHMDRNEVIEAMKANGLLASSVCCSTHWELLLSHPDPAIREKGVENIIIAMEDAKAYQTDALLIVPGRVDANTGYDECWDRSTACIRQLVPIAEKLKVKLCVENVWNNFLLSPLEAKRYVDQFNSPYVRFYFDCGNILMYGWPEQWINILGDRIGRIHIKEFSTKTADTKGRWEGFGTPLTEGDVDWKKVMEAARKHYKGTWLTTEQGPAGTPEELKDLRNRLDRIING
ncbi:sugar phosphate isomerase/epimerase family protein [Parabacteroides sp. PF5-6]|uniref:sugar phosphate isomerase/epimerase family protein n=1 Tax=Parabacteroides sp. PF5-6 TaxID=1742403 RepID=UPI0024069050|nr:sugar phosphate isomerase/epimerase family protein [Parabacteroides sp. PF5-6]MDF9829682.1 L-ribulose-5-phosphate 3-epimerase [Parabacteroides sp. PF5-6]